MTSYVLIIALFIAPTTSAPKGISGTEQIVVPSEAACHKLLDDMHAHFDDSGYLFGGCFKVGE